MTILSVIADELRIAADRADLTLEQLAARVHYLADALAGDLSLDGDYVEELVEAKPAPLVREGTVILAAARFRPA
jgi:hypothetical protein